MDSISAYDSEQKRYFPVSAIFKKRFWRKKYFNKNKVWPD